jgi:uridine kinase
MSIHKHSLVIGIAGGTGSGKTTVANAILEQVGEKEVSYLPHDAYYMDLSNLPTVQRENVNFDHPNSLDSNLMKKHIVQLKAGQEIELPIYDFTTHTRTNKTIDIPANPVILVEGILIFVDPELRKLFDVKLFVDTDPDVRLIRRIQRDITERYADIIIPEGGHNIVALEMVIARIESLLREIRKET